VLAHELFEPATGRRCVHRPTLARAPNPEAPDRSAGVDWEAASGSGR
jgi:hypothetical protein